MRPRSSEPSCGALRRGFTLIELLVVVAVIGLLISLLLPSLQAARRQARNAVCLSNLRTLGMGIAIYAGDFNDALVPGRLPAIDDCNAYAQINGGRKYRPTFLAMLSRSTAAPPFADVRACRNEIDAFGEPGDRQNYQASIYLCPEVYDWSDERNGAYGYNYQFLGNSRLLDPFDLVSYKNWPRRLFTVRDPSATVAVADSLGTAASFPPALRRDYENNGREATMLGNEGFNLDPPRVDRLRGEMANFDSAPQSRTAADPRHAGRAAVLWVDGHADAQTPERLGYEIAHEVFTFEGENLLWTGTRRDEAWTPDFRP